VSEAYLSTQARNPGQSSQTSVWMLTFADLLSLLLTFFVMLNSAMSVDSNGYDQMRDSLSQRLNPSFENSHFTVKKSKGAETKATRPAIDVGYLDFVLKKKFAALKNSQIKLQKLDDRLRISLPQSALFKPGGYSLSPEGSELMNQIVTGLGSLSNRVDVIGYADGVSSGAITWELSILRAGVAAQQLRRGGYEGPIDALGSGNAAAGDRLDIIIRPDAK
jgi:chemotaxis protein MotB